MLAATGGLRRKPCFLVEDGFLSASVLLWAKVVALVALLALAVTACGGRGGGSGGGGGSSPSVSINIAQSAPATRSSPPPGAEYGNSFGLRQSNAVMAYTDAIRAGGYTGAGVVLGQIDSGGYWSGAGGAARTHSELQGRLVTGSTDPGALLDGRAVPTASYSRHGISVAGIMVANRGDGGIHGVAPGAGLRIQTLSPSAVATLYTPVSLGYLSGSDVRMVNMMSDLLLQDDSRGNVLAINNSWGLDGLISDYTATDIRNVLPDFISAWAQTGVSASDRKIMVWAAGNANGDPAARGGVVRASVPELLPGLPHHISELRGHSLAVVSVGSGGVISSFSNRCGIAASFCLAAPGEFAGNGWRAATDVGAPDNVQSYRSDGYGTSFAAPLVTGALALLKERFPTMGNHQLVSRLLATATKTGRYAESGVYGQGLLNVDASLTMPVGAVRIHLGRSLDDGTAHSLAGSALSLSSPLSALRASTHQLEAYDELGTPFRHSLRSLLHSEDGSGDALRRLLAARTLDARLLRHGEGSYAVAYGGMDIDGQRAYGSRLWFRVADKAFWFGSGLGARSRHAEPMFSGIQGFSSPFTGMAEGGLAVGMEGKDVADSVWRLQAYVPGASHSSLDGVNTLGLAASLSSFTGSSPWRFSVGMLREAASALSSAGAGAFGGIDATTWHGGVDVSHHFGAWSAYAAGHYGVTSGGSGAGLWRGVDSVRSSSWALGLVRRGVFSGEDALGARVVQSLRAEGGSVSLLLPDSRDRYGNLHSREVSLAVEPGGRELDFALGWWRALPSGGSFSMDFGVTMEPGHDAGSSSMVWGGLAWAHSL